MADSDLDRIREVLKQYVTEETELDAVFRGEPIMEAAAVDSLTMVHIVTELEKAFGIRFDLDTIEQVFLNIHSLAAFLGEAQGQNTG